MNPAPTPVTHDPSPPPSPHIVVLGAGFAGLAFCQQFHHPNSRITLIDRQNHHLFQPLLYQVATAGLSAPEIAQPIRSILAQRQDVSVLLDEVTDIHLQEKRIQLRDRSISFDYLIIALGGVATYFGHPEWASIAPPLKSLEDAVTIRRKVLLAFERAETEQDPARQKQLMTLVIVGGGPTGVELAGAFAELTQVVLKSDFRRIQPEEARVILIEASENVLSNMDLELAQNATETLRNMGVIVKTRTKVRAMEPGRVELDTGEVIEAENVLWAAGVGAHPLTRRLGVPLDRAGRILVEPDLSLPGHRSVFAVGDLASVKQKNGLPVPGVSPAAIQMARHAADLITEELARPGRMQEQPREPFCYWDKGTMATIGRSAAVAHVGSLKLTGYTAWLAWLFVHLLFLIGFRNKLAVLLQWCYAYVTYKRGARIILPGPDYSAAPPPTPKQARI